MKDPFPAGLQAPMMLAILEKGCYNPKVLAWVRNLEKLPSNTKFQDYIAR